MAKRYQLDCICMSFKKSSDNAGRSTDSCTVNAAPGAHGWLRFCLFVDSVIPGISASRAKFAANFFNV